MLLLRERLRKGVEKRGKSFKLHVHVTTADSNLEWPDHHSTFIL